MLDARKKVNGYQVNRKPGGSTVRRPVAGYQDSRISGNKDRRRTKEEVNWWIRELVN